MIDVNYPALLDLFPEHLDPMRSDSAAFLIWYLQNYYRLDELEAVDSVCDQSGDKGVDGIYVNENDRTITVFQAKISQSSIKTIGDTSLREFAGTLAQFSSLESFQAMIAGAGKTKLAELADHLELINKVGDYELRGEFLSNINVDTNGIGFLKSTPHITFIGPTDLEAKWTSDERNTPIHGEVSFDIVGFSTTEYIVDANTKAIIAPIKATELVKLDGISNQSLFAHNVRGPLGKTQVNKDIVLSIRNASTHRLFPLFHNGITVIAGNLQVVDGKLKVEDYFVVNGCQSLTSLFDNRGYLTDDLRVLTKFIKLESNPSLSEKVTRYSNNQNGVKPRDFVANTPIQIRLQNEFISDFAGQYAFEIKRGEPAGIGKVISNEDAGLYLMAFDLKEPWATHRKYQIFDDKHAAIFGRPVVTADRIVLCHVIREVIDEASVAIKNRLFARYVLTRYLLLYVAREILESSDLSKEVLTKPVNFVRDITDRNKFRKCIQNIIDDVIIDLNAEIDEYGDNFDYRAKLRDSDWVQNIRRRLVSDYLKQVKRGRAESFKTCWETDS